MKKGLIIFLICTTLFTIHACKKNRNEILGSGSFEATEVLISSEVSGKILEWNVDEGDQITPDTYIGLVDTTQLYLQKEYLARSEKSVLAAKPDIEAQTGALEVQLNDLRHQKQRIEKLVNAGVATQKELDDINTGIASIESQLDATRSTLIKSGAQITAQSSSLDVQIAQIDDMIQRSIIRSPISGTVIGTYTRAGELTGKGHPLLRIADLENLYLRAYVRASELSNIKLGDKVLVRVEMSGDGAGEYQGVVTWISHESEFTPKSVQTDDERANLVYAVKIRVQNDGNIRIGMYGEVIKR